MVRPADNYAGSWLTRGYSKWYCARRDVSVLARTIRSALKRSFDFPDGKPLRGNKLLREQYIHKKVGVAV